MAAASPPKAPKQAEQPPLTFEEHMEAVHKAFTAFSVVLSRAEAAGHVGCFSLVTTAHQRTFSVGLEPGL